MTDTKVDHAGAIRAVTETPGAPVELLRVSKSYGGFLAVDDIALSVKAGEFLTLLGPSGSGKTTTLMLVAGFETADYGEILIGDKAVTGVPPYGRNLGFVFQHYALFPHLSVAENLAFPLKIRNVDADTISRRVAESLDLVMLPELHGRMPAQLSGGQQQRIALARALIFNPPVLLMDEPLSALDRKLRQQMQLEIKQIQRDLGVTVIYVTHDQEEALTMSDRIAVMNDGKIVQVAVPEEIYERPSDGFVADFIGETNFLFGVVDSSDQGRTVLMTDDGIAWPMGARTEFDHGQRLRLALRPEKMRLHAVGREGEGPCGPGVQSVKGKIENVIYLGDLCKYAIRIQSNILTCKELMATQNTQFQAGEQVQVAWRDEDLRVLPA